MSILDHVYYDETSKTLFRWKRQVGPRRAGDVAGHVCKADGYAFITLEGVKYSVQYLVWELFGKELEDGKIIDHINGNRQDNRIHNLRLCTYSQNNMNRTIPSHSTTGVKGLTYHVKEERWYGSITVLGKRYYKKSKDRAVVEEWLKEMRKELHGEFAKE